MAAKKTAIQAGQIAQEDNALPVKKRKTTDYQPDPANANTGTERGLRALDDSLAQYGAGRSILSDKNGYIVAGNKTLERAVDLGILDVIEVETDGHQLVVVRRTDLDLLSDQKARAMAYADNRVGQLDREWNLEQLLADVNAGIELPQSLFTEMELEHLLHLGETVDDPAAEWQGMPEFEQEGVTDNKLTVYFADDAGREEFAELTGQQVTPKTKFIWFPGDAKPARQSVDSIKAVSDES